MVQKRVAAIVANTNAAPYVISATKNIPIVLVTGSDPVAAGFVQNLNHPGGNVTAVSFFTKCLVQSGLKFCMNSYPKLKLLPF